MMPIGVYNKSEHKNWNKIHKSHLVSYQQYTEFFALDADEDNICQCYLWPNWKF